MITETVAFTRLGQAVASVPGTAQLPDSVAGPSDAALAVWWVADSVASTSAGADAGSWPVLIK